MIDTMEKKQLLIDYCEYDSLAEMPACDRELMECAMDATRSSYSPYSRFRAVRRAGGAIHRLGPASRAGGDGFGRGR